MVRVLSAFLVSIATAALVTSCGQATGVSNTDGDASLTSGMPQVQSWGAGVSGTIPLVITNTGLSTVVFSICGTTLERSVDGNWQTVNSVTCALGPPTNDVEIAPNSQHTSQFPVGAILGYGSTEQWKPPLAGTYRLKAAMRTNNKLLVRVTAAFQLGT